MSEIGTLAGKLTLAVRHDGERIRALDIRSSRPLQLTQLFHGKSPEQVVGMVPLLYSLCGTAQQVAALQAAEQALGMPAAELARHARQQLVAAETVRELGLRLALHGLPELVPPPAALIRWFQTVKGELAWALSLNPVVPPAGVDYRVLADELGRMMQPLTQAFEQLDNRQGALHGALERMQAQFGEYTLGQGTEPLTQMQPWIVAALAGVEAESFVVAPSFDGQCYETGSWAMGCNAEPVRRAATQGYGALALRRLAQVSVLRETVAVWCGASVRFAPGEGRVACSMPADEGLGVVRAARGLLVHRLVLAGQSVADYRILAPTEWNFHPQGTLVQMLTGVEVPLVQVKPLVEQLVQLVDPCVAFEIEVESSDA
jgi:hypothetical protein